MVLGNVHAHMNGTYTKKVPEKRHLFSSENRRIKLSNLKEYNKSREKTSQIQKRKSCKAADPYIYICKEKKIWRICVFV